MTDVTERGYKWGSKGPHVEHSKRRGDSKKAIIVGYGMVMKKVKGRESQ